MSLTFPTSRYDEIVDETIAKIKELGMKKGGEYAGDKDRLANFRRNAEAWGITMEQCWGIYISKHWDAIKQYVEDLATGKERERMEPLAGRVDDMIVYLLLFKAMLEERETQKYGGMSTSQGATEAPTPLTWIKDHPELFTAAGPKTTMPHFSETKDSF